VGLISPSDQQRLRDTFSEMTRRVRLMFVTQTLDCETCVQTRQILDELPPLSDKITIEEINLILDRDTAQRFGIDRSPAIAVTYQDGVAAPPESTDIAGDAPAGSSQPTDGPNGSASQAEASNWIDSRIRFLGAPAGYEFMSLVQAVLVAGGRGTSLSADSLARLAAVTRPVTLQVFTTPT
jgi:hypothetical protein